MGSILIVAEIQKSKIRDASYELVSMAHKIAGGREIKSLVLGSGVAGEAEVLAKRGGGEVLVADSEALANYNVDGYAKAILAAVEAASADLVLISNTPTGWDVAPRIAASLDCGFISDCFKIEEEGGKLVYYRRVFNGKLDARLLPNADRIVATVQSGAISPFEGSTEGRTTALGVSIGEGDLRAKFLESRVAGAKGVDLTKADIIVAGGRGLGAAEKFDQVIKPLAEALGGAVGASRPVVDAGWLDHAYQVGSSGQVVSPKLYIAAGISGAIQHLVGMKSANFIVAINKDRDAPIFEVAHVGVAADLFEIVPALTAAIQEAKG
jgi:electron transfer flavoprotein alpha subunit